MSSLGGIIAGALAGGGAAVQGMAQEDLSAQHKADLIQQQQQAELDKMKAAKDYEVSLQNSQREARVGRIQTAQGGLVDNLLKSKYAGADAVAAGQTDSPLTPDQQSVVDGARGADRSRLMANTELRLEAAAQTGDYDIPDQASNNRRMNNAESRADAMRYSADARAGGLTDAAQTRADSQERQTAAKIAALNPADKALHTLMVSYAESIKQASQDVRAKEANLVALTGPDKAAAVAEIAAKKASIAGMNKKLDDMRTTAPAGVQQTFGAAEPDAPMPASTPVSAPAPAPSGSAGSGGSKAVTAAMQLFNQQIGQ